VYAENCAWIKRGYELWAEDINAAGGLLGRPVELIIYDNEAKIDKSIALLEKAITVDKVDLLLGNYGAYLIAAEVPLVEKYKMTYISMGGNMVSFSQGYKYFLSATPLMGEWWAEAFGEFLESLPKGDRPTGAAILTMNMETGFGIRASILGWLGKLAIPILVDEYYDLPLASADSLVAKCRASGADVVFANGLAPDGILTVRAMKAQGYNPKFFFQSVGCVVPAWVAELGKEGDWVFSGTVMHSSLPYPDIQRLKQIAKEKYDLPYAPTYFLFGYSWMQTLQRGVEGAGSLNHDDIVGYLKTHEIEVMGGKFTLDERGLPEPYGYCTQVQNGVVQLVWPPDIATAEAVYPKPPWGE
jgi:branched-chain amino acid transport system substrate-binding protein